MNELHIDYNKRGYKENLASVVISYAGLVSLYMSAERAFQSDYNVIFFVSLLLFIFCVIYVLLFVVRKPKPLLVFNSESFSTNLPGLKPLSIQWQGVIEMGIGVSYLIFKTKDSKQYKVELGQFKYDDLKEIKTRVIELCENKDIPFHNE